jgi:L-rhamnose isomerase
MKSWLPQTKDANELTAAALKISAVRCARRITVAGNYPGKARTPDELHVNLDKVPSFSQQKSGRP